MGSYLSQPVKTKTTDVGTCDKFAYASTSMQGWRTEMEDAHLTIPNLGGSLDGVNDGHGGREVAKFVENWLPREAIRLGDPNDLRSSMIKLYNRYEIQMSSISIVSRMDDLLRDPQNKDEVLSYRSQPQANDESSNKNARALSLLQGSIQTDLQELREKRGQVSRDDATKVMMKMMFLRRLEQQQQTGENGDSSTSHPSSESAAATVDVIQPTVADSVGCTAVSVLITSTEYIAVNVGDSRAVLCRNGDAVALTEDHKPNDEKETARITKAGGTIEETQGGARIHYRVNGNLNLSRAIGDLEYKKNKDLSPAEQIITSTPDVLCLERSPLDEFLVIGCDGVWDVLTNDECIKFIRTRIAEGKSLGTICEEIADECLSPDPKATQGIGADNITCIIVHFQHQEQNVHTS